MDYIYAQLNKDNICTTISYLTGEISGENIVRISWNDFDVLGKLYKDGQWLDPLNGNDSE